MSREQESNELVELMNLCKSDPDRGLAEIDELKQRSPNLGTNPFLLFAEALGYEGKIMAHLRRRITIPMDHLDFDEVIEESLAHIGDEECRQLELGLSALGRIEQAHPGFVSGIGTEDEPVGDATLTLLCHLLERTRPGRVQQIMGKTKLEPGSCSGSLVA